jgi:thymidylate kinase
MPRGAIITISGLDGSGKSTQVDAITAFVRENGFASQYLWSRIGYTPGFLAVKALLRRILRKRLPQAGDAVARDRVLRKGWARSLWLAIAVTDLAWTYGVRARMLRRREVVVICDRYLWDSLVDLELTFGVENPTRKLWWRLLQRLTPKPDLAIFLEVSLEETIKRSELKDEPFPDADHIRRQRSERYPGLAQTADWTIIPAEAGIDSVTASVIANVRRALRLG